jgi:hypothetical protein
MYNIGETSPNSCTANDPTPPVSLSLSRPLSTALPQSTPPNINTHPPRETCSLLTSPLLRPPPTSHRPETTDSHVLRSSLLSPSSLPKMFLTSASLHHALHSKSYLRLLADLIAVGIIAVTYICMHAYDGMGCNGMQRSQTF